MPPPEDVGEGSAEAKDVTQRVTLYSQQLDAALAKSDNEGVERALGVLLIVLGKKSSAVEVSAASPLVRSLCRVYKLGPPRPGNPIEVLIKLANSVSVADGPYLAELHTAYELLHSAGNLSNLSDVASSPERLEVLHNALHVGERIARFLPLRSSTRIHSEDSGSDDDSSVYLSSAVYPHYQRSGSLCMDALGVLSQMLIAETPGRAASGGMSSLQTPVVAILYASITLRKIRTVPLWDILFSYKEDEGLELDRLYPALIQASRACTALSACATEFENLTSHVRDLTVTIFANVLQKDEYLPHDLLSQLTAGAVPFMLEFMPVDVGSALPTLKWISVVCSQSDDCKTLLVTSGVAKTLASLVDKSPPQQVDEKAAPLTFAAMLHEATLITSQIIPLVSADEVRCLLLAFVELCDRLLPAAPSKDFNTVRRNTLSLIELGCDREDACIPSRAPLLAMSSLPPLPSQCRYSTMSDQLIHSVALRTAELLSKFSKLLPFETLPCALLLGHHLASVELLADLSSNEEVYVMASLTECWKSVQHAAGAMASSRALLESMDSLPGAQDGYCADSFFLLHLGPDARKGKSPGYLDRFRCAGADALSEVARKAGADLPACLRKSTLDSVLVHLQRFASGVTLPATKECEHALQDTSRCSEAVEALLHPVPAFCDIDPAVISSAIDAAMRPFTARKGACIPLPFIIMSRSP